jgi:ABC-type multidrug transport system permease subunit
MSDPSALRELVLTRVRVMFREPEVLFWVFFFPVLLALGIGVAFADRSPERFRIGVERGSAAEAHVAALGASPELEAVLLEPGGGTDALRRGEVALVAEGAAGATVVLRFDPTRPEARAARAIVEAVLQEAAGATRPLAIREEEVRARGQRYIDWLIPGLIGFNLMGTGLWSVGFYTTQVRETRVLRRLVATPMRRSDFLLAQILARYVFLLGEVPVIMIFAWLAFGVPVEGSLASVALIVVLGATCFSGLGLLAASRARTSEGVSGIINVIMMPMLILSGVFFSVERFPETAQALIRLLPLTAVNDALRAIYNDGNGLLSVLPEVGVLALWTGGAFYAALRLFRWQ